MKKRFLQIFPIAVVVAAGGFYAWTAALAGGVLLFYLGYLMRQSGKLRLRLNYTVSALALILLGYGLGVLWATDHGMAGYGFVKFLPVALYALVLMQHEPEELRDILRIVPWAGAVMTAGTFLLQFVPVISKYVLINSRLTGTFQYANTYALYLLIGCVVLLFDRKPDRWTLILGAVLVFGIFASGSRTTVVLLGVLIVMFCIRSRNKKYIAGLAALLVAAALVAVGLAAFGVIDSARFLTIFSTPATLLERLLYWKDSLVLILSHPLGLGYLGYSTLQNSVQTGVYNTRFVHNEVLQLLLDVGWLPTGVLVSAWIRSFFRKDRDVLSRAVLFTVAAHAMIDFDLQFLSVWLLLIPAMDLTRGREITVKKPLRPAAAICGVLAAISLWLGVGDCLYTFGLTDACLRVTPFYTEAWAQKLEAAATVDELALAADRILALNDDAAIAHNARGDVAFSRGDIAEMVQEKECAISLAPYYREYYCDYFDKVWQVLERYQSMGDAESERVCAEILRSIPQRLAQVRQKTDPIAWKLKHLPELELPEEYLQRLASLDA